jgi:anti-sigma factor RsiW
MGTTCKDSIDLLLEYLDGELPADVRARLDEHLGGCSPCEEFLKTYRETSSLCRKALNRDMPKEIASKLHEFLKRETGGKCR